MRADGARRVRINTRDASGGSLTDAPMAEGVTCGINLLGVVRGCRAFVPDMIAAKRGHIINTASFAALAGAPHIMTYGVSKAGVYTLSEQLRAELHGSGVKVSVLCPAFFQTNLLQSWRGNERMRAAAGRLMQHSGDTLDSVADYAFAACERGEFLVLPTRSEPMRWRMKRWFPTLYFSQLMKLIAQDKKVQRGKLNFILVRGIGQAFVARDIDPAQVREFLEQTLSR